MPIATNQVVNMPEPSNRESSAPDLSFSAGHRSPQKFSGAENSSAISDAPVGSSANPQPAPPSTEVFAVYGVEPEVQAYAMAKYSRSSLSMKESLREMNSQKAEKFLNTFYFQYGHRSIADLAHISLAVERLSLTGGD